MRRVLFLCTGNYYRSRFAQILFNDLAARAGLPWRASSRGLRAGLAGPGSISPLTLARLAMIGIEQRDDVAAIPTQCGESDMTHADRIIALKEDEHRAMLAEQFPGWEDRVTYWHVHDLDQARAEVALAEIEQLVRALVDELKAKLESGS
jgi:protein-tyrosine phosphatase